MNPPMCVWAFLLLNSIRKYIETSGPYQPVSFTSQKPERCINSQKSLQLSKLSLFFFFRAWLFSDPLSSVRGEPALCTVAVCTNKTSRKTGVPRCRVRKTQQRKQAAEMFGCGCSHLLPLPPSATPAEMIVGQRLHHEALLAKARSFLTQPGRKARMRLSQKSCKAYTLTVEHHQTSSTAPFFAERRRPKFLLFIASCV